MKPDQFKILWAAPADRAEGIRATLAALGENDVQPVEAVGRAPADLQGQDTAVVFMRRSAAHDLEENAAEVKKQLLAAGVPATTATPDDLKENGAVWERRRARLIEFAHAELRAANASKERAETLARLSIGDVLEEFQNLDAPDPPLYKTGLDALDRVLGGGLREGVYVLQGVPGGGKTALSLYIAASIVQGNPEARVLYHSLEMSRRQVTARVLARLAFDLAAAPAEKEKMGRYFYADKFAPRELDWQTPSRLRDLDTTEDGRLIQSETVSEAEAILDRLLVAYRGAGGPPTVERLAAIGKAVAEAGPAPIVFVDYLQLIAPPEDYRGERRDVVGYNSTMLEEMAHALRTPVVVLSSMNRTAVTAAQREGRVSMGASKESGDIDYNADAILGLVDVLKDKETGEPLTFSEDEGHRVGKVVEIQVAKNRTGTTTYAGTHPRFDWLTAWGVYEPTRHAVENDGGGGAEAFIAGAKRGRR